MALTHASESSHVASPARGSLRSFRPGRAQLEELIRIAVPVVVVQVGIMLMGVVDTVMVGHVSPRDLAAVALGNLYFFTCAIFGLGILYALDPVVSQAVGAGDEDTIARSVQRATLLAIGLGLLSSLAMAPAGPVFRLLRQPLDVIPVGQGYVHASLAGIVPFFLFIVLRLTLQAMGRVAPIVVTVVVANLANLFFNWTLIYGHLGLPALGAVGAGWASTLARWFMLLLLLAISWPVMVRHLRPLRVEIFRVTPLRALLGVGLPIGMQLALEFGAFAAIGVLMGWLGTVAMAGHQVAINLASLTFMVPLGIAQATAVLVGRAVGREDPPAARRAAGAGLGAGALFMACMAITLLVAPGPLARLYSDDPEVLAVAAALLPLAGLFQVFDGLQVVASAVLRGVADTRVPMVVNVLGFWICGMPISLLLGFRLGAGPVGLWWGLVAGLAAVAVFLLARIRQRFGGELKRLVLAGH